MHRLKSICATAARTVELELLMFHSQSFHLIRVNKPTWTISVLYFLQTSSTDILCSVCKELSVFKYNGINKGKDINTIDFRLHTACVCVCGWSVHTIGTSFLRSSKSFPPFFLGDSFSSLSCVVATR